MSTPGTSENENAMTTPDSLPPRTVDDLLALAERSETAIDGQVVTNYVFKKDITIAEYLAFTKHLSDQPHTIVSPGMTCVAFNLRLDKHDGASLPRIQDGVFVPLVVHSMPIRLSPKGTTGSVGACQSPLKAAHPRHLAPEPPGSTSSPWPSLDSASCFKSFAPSSRSAT